MKILSTLRLPTGWLNLDLPDPPERGLRLEDVIDLDDAQEWWNTTRSGASLSHDERRTPAAGGRAASRPVPAGGHGVPARARGGQRAEVRFDGLAGCLRTPRGGSGKQIVVAVDAGRLRMRWMSPREYARLQGAPDFPLAGGRNQQLFGFGDAVCVPAVRWVDRHILTPLYESAEAARRNGHAGQPES